MKYYKRIDDLVARALKGEDVSFLLGQMGMVLDHIPVTDVTKGINQVYRKDIEKKGILKRHAVEAAILMYLVTLFKDEKENRVMLAKTLAEMTRQRAREAAMQRFVGWASSLPAIPRKVNKQEITRYILEPIKEAPKHEKLIAQDQARKMQTNMDAIVADEGGAIGYYWHSNYRVPGYRYREAHKHLDMDGKFIIYRNNWAEQQGLMKRGNEIYQDEIEQPGELPNCRCAAKFVYTLDDIPFECLTNKGKTYKSVL